VTRGVDRCRAHIFVSGRVQGVSFRYAALRQAGHVGVTGWVRNLTDGRVEIVCEGEARGMRQMVDWCHEGPPGALIEEVEVAWEHPTGEFSTFEIAATATVERRARPEDDESEEEEG
jgi:acylphosphatase